MNNLLLKMTALGLLGAMPGAQALDPTALSATRMIDLDGDGRLDRMAISADRISIAWNEGGRVFDDVRVIAARGVTSVLVDDLDGDGTPDLYLIANGPNRALVGTGLREFVERTSELGLSHMGNGIGAQRLDIDADGSLDLLLQNVDGDVVFWGAREGGYTRDPSYVGRSGLSSNGSAVSPQMDRLVGLAGGAPTSTATPSITLSGEARSTRSSSLVLGGARRAVSTTLVAGASQGSGSATEPEGANATQMGARKSLLNCAKSLDDASTGGCIQADSTPTLGRLYPLGTDFNIDASGDVGIGTTTPTERLTVAGVVESRTGGFRFPDGSLQATATDGVPPGTVILTNSSAAPSGYTTTGRTTLLGSDDFGAWSSAPPMPSIHGACAVATIGDVVYVFGGYDGTWTTRVDAYDTNTATWSTKAPMLHTLGYASVQIFNGKAYLLTGYNATVGYTSQVLIYDPVTDSWSSGTSTPGSNQASSASALINGEIFLFGGYDLGTSVPTVRAYNPTTDTWTTKPSMPTARRWPSAMTLGTDVYVVGGYDSTYLSVVEVYDTLTGTWSAGPSTPTPIYFSSAVSLDGRGLVMGGYDGSIYQTTVYEFDPTLQSWVTLASMPSSHYATGASVHDGIVYLPGGFDSATGYYAKMDTFDRGSVPLLLYGHLKN